MDGQMIAFSPHTTSTSACQLNVDGFGLKGLRPSPGVDFIGGELIQGTPYTARYNNSDGVWYVHGFMSSPYAVPFLGGMDYWDTVTPNSAFILPAGQAISRTVYSRAFARWGRRLAPVMVRPRSTSPTSAGASLPRLTIWAGATRRASLTVTVYWRRGASRSDMRTAKVLTRWALAKFPRSRRPEALP